MHLESFTYLTQHLDGQEWGRVLDIGSRNVNGSPRDWLKCESYYGIDVVPGDGVDEVADAAHWRAPELFDLVICTETFEHAREWRRILRVMAASLRVGGLAVVTAACDPREPHSGIDGAVNGVRDDEWYANVDPDELRALAEHLFDEVTVQVLDRGDVRLTAWKQFDRIDVVTLSKTPYLFERAAKGMAEQGVKFQGYVVDNTQWGTLLPVAQEYGWEWIPYPKDLTFSKGNNAAVQEGVNSRILFLNDDAMLQPGCVQTMLQHPEEVVGCLILGTEGYVNHAGVEWTGGGFMHMGRGNNPNLWEGEDEYTISTTFATVLVDRKTFERVGGLGEMFEWGFEDTDFSLKVWESGGKVVTCRAARCVHDEFGTRTIEHDERNAAKLGGKWLATRRLFSVIPDQKVAWEHGQPPPP